MPIGLNSATAADLTMVQGIGEKTAERILETRAELGRFKAVDDLLEVKGIGEKKLEKFRRSFYID
jgi:competence protein ComEA